MSLFDSLYEIVDRPNRGSPSGKPYIEPQWLRWQKGMGTTTTKMMFLTLRIRRFIIIVCWLFIFAGILPPVRMLAAIGIPFLIFLHLQNRKCWRNTGYVAVSAESYPERVKSNEEFDVVLVVTNFGKSVVPSVVIQLAFAGDHTDFKYRLIQDLRPRHKQKLKFRFKADKGWGEFWLGPVAISVRDELGLYLKTIEDDVHGQIVVEPEHKELVNKVQVTRANLAMHSGNFEMAVAGRSVSFLGLRPWVNGDSVRSIDWKRSLRVGELVVKDFERFSATDASIIFDRGINGHSEFGAISTYRVLLESVMGLLQCLVTQQIRTQLMAFDFKVPFGKTASFYSEVAELLVEVHPENCGRFDDQIASYIEYLPRSSMLFLVSTTGNFDLDNMLSPLLALETRDIEPIVILIDSAAYGRMITKMANIQDVSDYGYLGRLLSSAESMNQSVQQTVNKLVERTYILNPNNSLSSVYDRHIGL